jgi:hypothetical protein
MANELKDINGFELLFWFFFIVWQLSWIYLGVHEVVVFLYNAFRVEETDRLLREVEALRCEKSESEECFDKHYYSKDYMLFENEK